MKSESMLILLTVTRGMYIFLIDCFNFYLIRTALLVRRATFPPDLRAQASCMRVLTASACGEWYEFG